MKNQPTVVSVKSLTFSQDSVAIELKYDFPDRYLNKKMSIRYYPSIIIGNDTINLGSKTFSGLKAHVGTNIISYKYGGQFSISDTFVFRESENKFVVLIESKAKHANKVFELELPPEIIFIYEEQYE